MSISRKSSTRSFFRKDLQGLKLCLLALFLLLCTLLGLWGGSTKLSLFETCLSVLRGDSSSPQARILLYVRLPRVSASLLSGAALAASGVLIQAVLQNPMAAPNVIGVNAGAGFFTFLTLALFPAHLAFAPLGAFAGALLAALLVYGAASIAGAGKLTIILAGVAISSMFTAGINFIKTISPESLYNGSSFLIGGFSGVSFRDLFPAFWLILISLLLSLLFSSHADLLRLGDDSAQSLGINVKLCRFTLLLLACLLAGSAVSFSGLLGFVGLIVPHIARRLFGVSHRILLPASALFGAALVTLCDLLSRLLFAPYEIPVGILLSLLGGPFFLFLLLKRPRGRREGDPR